MLIQLKEILLDTNRGYTKCLIEHHGETYNQGHHKPNYDIAVLPVNTLKLYIHHWNQYQINSSMA